MKNSCIIKGNANGIRLVLDGTVPFDELLENIGESIHSAAHFFKDARIALSLEGRNLSAFEEKKIVESIERNSGMTVVCIIDENMERKNMYRQAVNEKLLQLSSAYGNFYKGTLEQGQVLESHKSIIIIGDVKKGAKIRCVGSIIVVGSLEGSAWAGICGDENSYITAMNFCPEQLKIGSVLWNPVRGRHPSAMKTGSVLWNPIRRRHPSAMEEFMIARRYKDTIQIDSM